jgi:putative transposase
MAVINGVISLCHTALDGHVGNNPAMHMVCSMGLHLIFKLRHDAAL